MRAVGYQVSMPVQDPSSLLDIELERPLAAGRDLLVRVHAVSANPIDAKMRMRASAQPPDYKILGWDVAGTVEAVGPDCTRYRPGDAVFYAGALTRQGGNAEFHLVDERLAGTKPRSLGYAEAAALPLTALTAWEALFDSLMCCGLFPEQRALLCEVSAMVDRGTIRTTLAEHFGTINAANLRRAHGLIESGQSRGKIVLEGF